MFKRIIKYIKSNLIEENANWFNASIALFAFGILAYFSLSFEPSVWLTLSFIEIIVVLGILFRNKLNIQYYIIAALIFVFGFSYAQLKAINLSHKFHVNENIVSIINGKVSKIKKNDIYGKKVIIKDAYLYNLDRKVDLVNISLTKYSDDIKVGDCIDVVANLKPVFSPAIPDGYQYDRRLFFDGIQATGYAIRRAEVVQCQTDDSLLDGVNKYIGGLRYNLTNQIYKSLPQEQASIASAIIAGEKGGISKKLIQAYRTAGLAHFLSISGLHMSMIVALVFFIVRFLLSLVPAIAREYDSKKFAAIIAMMVSLSYLFISGASIPTRRAFIMTTIVLIGVMTGRKAISIRSLAIAALFILLVSPQAIVSVSFQMSFVAVIALVSFYELYDEKVRKYLFNTEKNIILKFFRFIYIYVATVVISDFVASFAVLPFEVYHFNNFEPYNLIGNLIAAPIISLLIMPFALFSALLIPLGLDYYSLKILGWGIGILNNINYYICNLPYANMYIRSFSSFGLFLFSFGIIWLSVWKRKWRNWGFLFIVLGLFTYLFVKTPDVLISENVDLIGIKSNNKLILLSNNRKRFVRNVWQGKTALEKTSQNDNKKIKEILNNQKYYPELVELKCNEKECLLFDDIKIVKKNNKYEKIIVDDREIIDKTFTKANGAVSLYFDDNKYKIKTVKESVGKRLWNNF
jgi:competence protein ComEC